MRYYPTIFLNIFLILALLSVEKLTFAADIPITAAKPAIEEKANASEIPAIKSEKNVIKSITPPLSTESVLENPAILQSLKTQPVMFELFTSLNCLFCPQAEKTLANIAIQTHAIVLACHTDPETSDFPLSREFCALRQERYSASLSDGLMYTPQLILNGHVDAVGHDKNDVISGLNQILNDTVLPLTPRLSSEPSIFLVDIPAIDLKPDYTADIFMITYRPPLTLDKTLRQAALRPDPLIHIANHFVPLGGISGKPKTITVSFHPNADDVGFIIFIQRNDNKIIAAGEYAGPK